MNANRIVVLLFCSALGLLTAIAYVKRPAARINQASSVTTLASTEAGSGKVTEEPAGTPPQPGSSEAAARPFTWRQIESADYKQYIANLRQVGCPEETIRDIIIADVNKLYGARETALKPKISVSPQSAPPATMVSAQGLENRKQLREIQMEKRAVLKELLGIERPLDLLPSTSSRSYEVFEAGFKTVPAEKRDFVQTLQENYWQQSDALKAKYNNQRTPEYVEEYRKLTESHRSELAKVLTTQELEDYEIRTSATAKRLGQQLVTFAPHEEEFRQIFRAHREFEEKTARLQGPVADRQAAAQERAAALSQLTGQLRAALGEERFIEYQRAQDASYRNLARVGERYGVPQESVLQAYELEKSFRDQPVMAADPPMAPQPNRGENLRQLDEQMTAILGDKAAKAYRRLRGGSRGADPEP